MRLQEQAEIAGLILDLDRVGHLERYFRLLCHWNRTINLTSLPLAGLQGHTLDRLFIEPLQAAQFVEDAPLLWFDLGAGGGSPAIPLKIVRPLLRLTMVESRSRKAAFLSEVVRSLPLTTTDVLAMRFEELVRSVPAGQADLLTVRAVRIEAGLLKAAAELLKPEGRLLLFGAKSQGALKHRAFRAIQQLSLTGGDSIIQVLSRVA